MAQVKMKVVAVTPAMALEWLAYNTKNRPVRKGTVVDYAARMSRGEWHMNGEPIKFAKSGVLLDGQHRLEAILESEQTVDMMVVEGLDESAFETIDTGLKRTTSDYLAVEGEANCAVLASALRYLAVLQAGGSDFKMKLSNAQASNLLAAHPNIRASLTPGNKVKKIMVGALATALHYLFSSVDQDRAEQFFAQLATGTELTDGHPILQLRQRLLERPKGYSIKPVMMAALTIKAWNAFYLGQRMPNLRWRQSGEAPEPFPSISLTPGKVRRRRAA
jgi:hypothetical protein